MAKRHGHHGSLTYMRWKSMIQRCYYPSASNYQYYGAVGVTVCPQWLSFQDFLRDMGECPDPSMTLDRIKNHIGYEPGNCRWATKAEQNRNRSCCVEITHNGETRNITEWAAVSGLTPNALSMRLRLGWDFSRAITQPLKKRSKRD